VGLCELWLGDFHLVCHQQPHCFAGLVLLVVTVLLLLLLLLLLIASQVGVTSVEPGLLQQALAADIITFGSPSAVK
jgi:hypothetical protein